MEPSNDHEATIAREADKISAEGRLDLVAMAEVIFAMDFTMSVSDSDFLINYVRWRIDNPLAKKPTRFPASQI